MCRTSGRFVSFFLLSFVFLLCVGMGFLVVHAWADELSADVMAEDLASSSLPEAASEEVGSEDSDGFQVEGPASSDGQSSGDQQPSLDAPPLEPSPEEETESGGASGGPTVQDGVFPSEDSGPPSETEEGPVELPLDAPGGWEEDAPVLELVPEKEDLPPGLLADEEPGATLGASDSTVGSSELPPSDGISQDVRYIRVYLELFLYGVLPFLLAVVVVISGIWWFYCTFVRNVE